jgi:hypothetical protein
VHASLDGALGEYEDVIIALAEPGLERDLLFGGLGGGGGGARGEGEEREAVRRMLEAHCPTATAAQVGRLLGFLSRRTCVAGSAVWNQGDRGDRMVLLVAGGMESRLEEEAGTVEAVRKGHFIGELAMVMGGEGRRLTTVVATADCVYYEMAEGTWLRIKEEEPQYAVLVLTFACRYIQHRVQHVSNRFVETRCIPI